MRNHKTMIAAFVITLWGVALCSMGFAKDDKEFIPGEDSGFFYTIKKGDTLWDLSQKFYDSEWDWPGLWKINDDIKNPHWIYPGRKIRVFLKEKAALEPTIVKVQKAKNKIAPVKVKTSFSFSEMDHIGFVKKKMQLSLGSIIKEQDGNLMMSMNDIIYIKPSAEDTLIPGEIYHIFTTETIEKENNDQIFNGVKHLIKAQVKILEHKENYVVGKIIDANRTVYKDDLIMAYYKRDPILSVEDNPETIDARIICSEDNNLLVNDNRIAFIDAGKASVKPGQIYSIFRVNRIKDHTLLKIGKKDSMKLDNLETGKLIILHTEDIASTVMILSSKYAIHPDDMVN